MNTFDEWVQYAVVKQFIQITFHLYGLQCSYSYWYHFCFQIPQIPISDHIYSAYALSLVFTFLSVLPMRIACQLDMSTCTMCCMLAGITQSIFISKSKFLISSFSAGACKFFRTFLHWLFVAILTQLFSDLFCSN